MSPGRGAVDVCSSLPNLDGNVAWSPTIILWRVRVLDRMLRRLIIVFSYQYVLPHAMALVEVPPHGQALPEVLPHWKLLNVPDQLVKDVGDTLPGRGAGAGGARGQLPPSLSQWDGYACPLPPKFWQSLGLSTFLPPPSAQKKNRSGAPAAGWGGGVRPWPRLGGVSYDRDHDQNVCGMTASSQQSLVDENTLKDTKLRRRP